MTSRTHFGASALALGLAVALPPAHAGASKPPIQAQGHRGSGPAAGGASDHYFGVCHRPEQSARTQVRAGWLSKWPKVGSGARIRRPLPPAACRDLAVQRPGLVPATSARARNRLGWKHSRFIDSSELHSDSSPIFVCAFRRLASRSATEATTLAAAPARQRSTTTPCAWIFPSTAPCPNRPAIASVATAVASPWRAGLRASISLRNGVPYQKAAIRAASARLRAAIALICGGVAKSPSARSCRMAAALRNMTQA